MKEKFSQLFKDKLFLVMFVLGLLTMVAAAGVLTIQRENSPQEHPYMQMQEPGAMAAEEKETAAHPATRTIEILKGGSLCLWRVQQ